MLLHQYFSFNSPVWFNVGTASPQQVAACFILSVDDSMDSILNWYREEGFIFKGGRCRPEPLADPILEGAAELRRHRPARSRSCGAPMRVREPSSPEGDPSCRQDGRSRRGSSRHRGVHRDQAREENKIRALRDAGFDMDLGGRDITSVQYQNANNSVRVMIHASRRGRRRFRTAGPYRWSGSRL